MPRKLRFAHAEYQVQGHRFAGTGTLWDITTPVLDGLYLLRPDEDCRSIIYGVIGRALARWPFDVYAFHAMSTHWHLLAAFPDLRIKARVMRFLNGEIARRINRLRGRTGPLFARRHQAIQVLSDAHALDRIKYLLSQGTKAFVVRHPAEDPFACANAALLLGRPLRGRWHGEGETVDYTVELSPLPALAHLTRTEYRAALRQLADDVAREQRPRRKKAGRRLMGPERARTVDPWTRQTPGPRTPAPVVHGTEAQEAGWREAYGRARDAYTEASIAFRAWQADQAKVMIPWPPATLPPAFAESEMARWARAGP